MNTVRDLLNFKKNQTLSWVSPYDTVVTAIQKMSNSNLGAISVIDNDEIIGLFSEQDYTRKLLLKGKSPFTTQVHEVMVEKIIYATSDYTLEECLAVMTKNRIRHLPIIDNGIIRALLPIEDIIEAVMEDKEFLIDQLTKYVAGTPFVANQTQKINKLGIRELIWTQKKNYEEMSN